MKKNAFDIRMLYAPTGELMDYAAKSGMNWIVAETSGHGNVDLPYEDPPVYMPAFKKLHSRRKSLQPEIEAERRRLRGVFRYARKKGLKVVYHMYEVSLPRGTREAYPEIFVPMLREFSRSVPPDQQNDNVCVSDERVRELLSEKVRELVETFPEIDAIAYTHNESATHTQTWHRCEKCRKIPFSRMLKYLHDAFAEGIRRAGRPVRLFNRCWGSHETDFARQKAFEWRVKLGCHELPGKGWLPAYARAIKPAALHFKASRDIPPYIERLRGADTGFIYKASWADNNLHHPLNPWIGAYRGHDQVCELSWEHAYHESWNFYIMGHEMQRRARLCARKGASGLCGLTGSWGMHSCKIQRNMPSRQSLSALNLDLYAALTRDPDADLERVAMEFLADRYGRDLPRRRELAKLLLGTEDVAARSINVFGARNSGGPETPPENVHEFFGALLRYAPMFSGWPKSFMPTPKNIDRLARDKAKVCCDAGAMRRVVETLAPELPAEAAAEFRECFGRLNDMAVDFSQAQQALYRLWAFREKTIRPTTREIDEVYGLMRV